MRHLEEKSAKSCKNLLQNGIDRRGFGLPEQLLAVREQGGDEDAAEEDAADEFTGTDGQCQEPECARNRVSIAENQRDDDAVRDDRAECAEEAMLTECVGSECAEQGGEGAEDDVRQGASGQYVREEAADGDAWDRSWCEKREDGQYLGKAHLDGTACEIEACGERGQYDVEGGDHCGLNDGQNVA